MSQEAVDKIYEAMTLARAGFINLEAAARVLGGGTGPWYWDRLRAYIDGLFSFAPFQVGDRVALTKTPKIDAETSWGWMGSKHFLVEGATGKVVDLDYATGQFVAGVVFDNETWLDKDKIARPVEQSHTFYFGQSYLRKLTPDAE